MTEALHPSRVPRHALRAKTRQSLRLDVLPTPRRGRGVVILPSDLAENHLDNPAHSVDNRAREATYLPHDLSDPKHGTPRSFLILVEPDAATTMSNKGEP